jgi:hypothetical protein
MRQRCVHQKWTPSSSMRNVGAGMVSRPSRRRNLAR